MNKNSRAKVALVLAIVAVSALATGFALQTQAGGFNCKWVVCPPPQCEYGEHMETPPGQCCPVCVPD
jgi:hypothetical protein